MSVGFVVCVACTAKAPTTVVVAELPRSAPAAPHCREGDAPGCEAGCTRGDDSDCAALAAMLLRGEGVPQDYVRARSLAERACDARVMRGCNALALLLENGWGGSKDPDRARTLYQLACDHAEWRACENLGVAYLRGQLGVGQDAAAGAALLDKACDLGPPNICTDGGAYLAPGQPTENPKRAASLFSRACDRGDLAGCNGLGASYSRGAGVPRDLVRAEALFRRACDGNLGIGCKGLGDIAADTDPSRAADYYRRACSLGYQRACDKVE
jgi:uncharacterized protein